MEAPRGVEAPPALEASLAEPLFRHYFLAVASCGTYLLYRAYLLAGAPVFDGAFARAAPGR